LKGDGDGCDVNWIGNLDDTQNPYKMLLVDIQRYTAAPGDVTLRRWHYTAVPGDVTLWRWLTTRNVVAMANKVLQLVTLWQWSVAHGATTMAGNLQCCGDG